MLSSISQGSERLSRSRNGKMEQKFAVIPFFWNFRPTSQGTPKILNEIPENVCSICSPSRNLRNFWSNGKCPRIHLS